MGNTSQARKDFSNDKNSLLVGFENKSMTICYANSVLQVLFHHPVFIDIITKTKYSADGLIAELCGIYKLMEGKKQKSALSILKLMNYVQKKSGIFQIEHHQDCHEFYIWLMNTINDELKAINKKNGVNAPTKLQQQFFSKRVTRTECLQCHTISEREEQQVDLSLVLPEPNVSLNFCVENYSVVQKLVGRDKFKCDKCGDLQNAEKRTLIKTLPNFLSVHLRRFKYDQARKGIIKLMWLVPFPYKIRIKSNYSTTSKENENKIQMYEKGQKQIMYRLVGVVAHIGNGGNFGHYICYIKIGKQWYLFNDDEIQQIDDYMLQSLWGYKGMTKCAYMLFYTL